MIIQSNDDIFKYEVNNYYLTCKREKNNHKL